MSWALVVMCRLLTSKMLNDLSEPQFVHLKIVMISPSQGTREDEKAT